MMRPTIFAIDFGTSNSLLAAASASETFPPVPLDPDAPDATVLRSALFFARYRVRGERIELYPVDDEAVAKLVIDGKLDGTVDKTRNELRVYVRGSRAQMLALVREHAIFEDKPTLELVRRHEDVAAFER